MKTRSNRQTKVARRDRSGNSRSIELHIGELVLHGFAHADQRPIADSIEHELRALLTRDDFSNPTAFQVDQINAGSFDVHAAQPRESVGVNIARAIYGGLRQ